jgi:hypothetical protein
MVKPTREQRRSKNNPWEILVVAALFFFPGLFMLLQRGPLIAIQQSFRWVPSSITAISPHGAHIFGLIAIVVAALLVLLYLWVRRAITRAAPHIVEHGHERI